MQQLTVRNWERFQHYKERNPPWIKLHYEIMTSQDWVMLADASKLLAVVCMMIASRNEGRVPNDPHYIKRVAYLDSPPKLKPLIDCGFLIESASTCKRMQADARPETETETETYRTDTDKKDITNVISKKTPIRGTRLTQDWKLPSEWGRWAVDRGMTRQQVIDQQDRFRDYWSAKTGANATKADWEATWRNWIRKHLEG